MPNKDRILEVIDGLTAQYMTEKGWTKRRARRAAEAKVGRYLRRAMRHAPPGAPSPVMVTLGKLRLKELWRWTCEWVLSRGVYIVAGLAIGLLMGVLL